MRHLTSDQFVDLVEGTRDEASAPHLLACEVCRRQLADLRLMAASVAAPGRSVGSVGSPWNDVNDVNEVPEPSPLFWDHFSARVRAAVASEGVPARATLPWSWPRVALGAVAGAFAVVLMAAVGSYVTSVTSVTGPRITTPAVAPPVAQLEPLGSLDDPSLSLVVEYGNTLDWDEMREQMAVSTHRGGMDEAIADLNGGERLELQKLLKEELARPGAQTDRS